MFKRTKVSAAALLALGAIVLPAVGQTTQTIEITGSNLRRTDQETASPVQIITGADLQKSGYTSVSEVLQNLTANGQGTLSQSFNQAFAAGASGVSLRGLTVGATLVLIDGHRMAPYPLSDDGERPFVDISSIPFSAVERIEILKDGASAVYGSDAIAGVVNVILKKKFSGTLISADAGTTQHGGGQTGKVSIIHGFNGDNADLNGYVALEYRHQNEIKLDQRSGDWTNFDWRPQGGIDLRPGAYNPFVLTPRVATPFLQNPAGSSSSASSFAFYPGCNFTDLKADNCTYTNTWAQLQPTTENLNLIGKLNVALGANWNMTFTGSFFDSKAQQTRSPATVPFGSFAGYTVIGPGLAPSIVGAIASPNYTVPVTYPGNTLGVPAAIRGFALGGTTPRVEDVESGATRLVAELTGVIAGWDINGTAGYTRVKTTQTYHGYVDVDALYTALQSTSDPWLLTGGNSQANLNLVSPVVNSITTDELDFIGAHAARDLMQLQGGPLGLALGADFRYKNLNAPDPTQAFLSGAYAVGRERNSSAYAEIAAPVLKTLELSGAVRFDHYDTYGNSTTPKFGFKFTPVTEVAVRGTASRGFRAPSATENGTAGALFGFNKIRDPLLCPVLKADGTPDTANPANVPAYCNFAPTYLQTSTKDLQPEKSKSYTLGLIVEPIKGWSSTLDYYKITIDNQIVPAASLASYDPVANGVRGAPQLVTFGDGSTGLSSVGPIQYSTVPYVNGQTTETSGVELETRYKLALAEYGALTVDFQFTHMINYNQTINGVTVDLAGTHGPSIIGGNTGNPKDRAQFTLNYERGPFTVTTTTNYVGSYNVLDPSLGINDCSSGIEANNAQFANLDTPPQQYCKIGSFTTTNLSLQYKFDKALTLRGSIVNLFDRKPPVDLNTYGGTGSNSSSLGSGTPYNPSLHQAGAVGRFFTVGLDYKF